MIGKTNTGGALKAFAIIGVTYPAGSVCTCTDGAKTLTLKDTIGLGIFLIPYAATWTVMCYDGADYESSEKKKSEVVEITTKGQSESVTLTYELVLFDNGTDNTAVTGGWTTVRSNKLYASAHVDGRGEDYDTCESTNQIDLSEYNTIRFEGVTSTDSNGENRANKVGVEGTYTTFSIVTNSTIDVDISKVSLAKVQIIAAAASYSGSDTSTVKVSRVVLL